MRFVLALCLLLAVQAGNACAGILAVVPDTGRGHVGGVTSHNTYRVFSTGRPFFVYDIPELPNAAQIVGASLSIYTGSLTGSTVSVQFTSTPSWITYNALQTSNVGYTNLGVGAVYAQHTYTAATDQNKFIDVELNATAMEALFAARGTQIVISASLLSSSSTVAYGSTTTQTRLNITYIEAPPVIPLPSAGLLAMPALLAGAGYRRRRR